MQAVHVDPQARTATAEGGSLGAVFDRETQAFGLATTLGIVSEHGGLGTDARRRHRLAPATHGLTADNLVAAELVTAEGELVRASADENPDLFWGLRGGGGNFGVVTSFSYWLHPVGPDLLCGLLAWPAEEAADVLRFFRSFMAEAPDEVMTISILRTAPPAPFLPEAIHGRPIAAIACCYAGPPEEGEAALAPLRGARRARRRRVRGAALHRVPVDVRRLLGARPSPTTGRPSTLSGLLDECIDVAAAVCRSPTARRSRTSSSPPSAVRSPGSARTRRRPASATRRSCSTSTRLGRRGGVGAARRATPGSSTTPSCRPRRAASTSTSSGTRARSGCGPRTAMHARAFQELKRRYDPGQRLPLQPEHPARPAG